MIALAGEGGVGGISEYRSGGRCVEDEGLGRPLRDCVVEVDVISDDSLRAKNALCISLPAGDGESEWVPEAKGAEGGCGIGMTGCSGVVR